MNFDKTELESDYSSVITLSDSDFDSSLDPVLIGKEILDLLRNYEMAEIAVISGATNVAVAAVSKGYEVFAELLDPVNVDSPFNHINSITSSMRANNTAKTLQQIRNIIQTTYQSAKYKDFITTIIPDGTYETLSKIVSNEEAQKLEWGGYFVVESIEANTLLDMLTNNRDLADNEIDRLTGVEERKYSYEISKLTIQSNEAIKKMEIEAMVSISISNNQVRLAELEHNKCCRII
mmetsp:Transcript_17190/g.15517  ORF Transcript_17190/g.15517 Transcript_17190/m.15517 type:complete len:235 (+) Transcript_17190:31-735(+)